MSGSTFRELLSQPTDAAERPRALANGHYIGTIKGHEFGTSKQKQTPFVRFFVTPEEETSDVEEGANKGITLSDRELRKDLYITPKAMYRVADQLDAILGPETGRSYDERIPDTRGARVLFAVTSREVIDETTGKVTDVYNDVGTIVKV